MRAQPLLARRDAGGRPAADLAERRARAHGRRADFGAGGAEAVRRVRLPLPPPERAGFAVRRPPARRRLERGARGVAVGQRAGLLLCGLPRVRGIVPGARMASARSPGRRDGGPRRRRTLDLRRAVRPGHGSRPLRHGWRRDGRRRGGRPRAGCPVARFRRRRTRGRGGPGSPGLDRSRGRRRRPAARRLGAPLVRRDERRRRGGRARRHGLHDGLQARHGHGSGPRAVRRHRRHQQRRRLPALGRLRGAVDGRGDESRLRTHRRARAAEQLAAVLPVVPSGWRGRVDAGWTRPGMGGRVGGVRTPRGLAFRGQLPPPPRGGRDRKPDVSPARDRGVRPVGDPGLPGRLRAEGGRPGRTTGAALGRHGGVCLHARVRVSD